MDDICRITEISCPDGPQFFTFQRALPENCSISRVVCTSPSVSFPVQCTENFFGCAGCTYSASAVPCSDQCVQRVSNNVCVCPVDALGESCEERRKIFCKAAPIGSGTPCPNAKSQHEHYACFQYQQQDTISLGFKLDCEFDGFVLNRTEIETNRFNYIWKSNKLAISEPVSGWMLFLSFMNFNSQSDIYQEWATISAPDEDVWITLNLTRINKRYWMDSRIHIEASVVCGDTQITTPPASFVTLHILDDGEPTHQTSWYERNRPTIITASVIISIILFLVSAVVGKSVLAFFEPKAKVYLRI